MEVDDVAPAMTAAPSASAERLAKLWLKHGIDRKVVKRQVMTAAYNSNVYGFTDQIKADTMDKLHKRVLDPEDDIARASICIRLLLSRQPNTWRSLSMTRLVSICDKLTRHMTFFTACRPGRSGGSTCDDVAAGPFFQHE